MGDVDPEILFLYRSLDLGGVLLMGILGGTIARQRHFDVMGFLFLALFSSLGGGMIRDVVIGQVPGIFRGGKLYAIPALVSGASMVAFHVAGHDAVGMIISPVLGSGLAILSYWRGWSVATDPEWAPVNMTVAQLRRALRVAEVHGRNAARRIEPSPARRLRHAAMERAAARRKGMQDEIIRAARAGEWGPDPDPAP